MHNKKTKHILNQSCSFPLSGFSDEDFSRDAGERVHCFSALSQEGQRSQRCIL